MTLRRSTVLALAGLILLPLAGVGCAAFEDRGYVPAPAEIPSLERRVRADPTDVDAVARLAAAHLAEDRPGLARDLLESAYELRPDDGPVVYFLGRAHEDLGAPGEAIRLYTRHLEAHPESAAHDVIRAALPALRRAELRLAVREALTRERELADRPADTRSIAVFPFAYSGDDPTLSALGRALAEMFTTDLAQTDRLRVVERTRVQMLLDEMDLAEGALVEPETAVRSGRLLGAGRVVQGRFDDIGERLALDAAVVRIEAEPDDRLQTVSDGDVLERLFAMQKRMVFRIYEGVGIELTPAERMRVEHRPTENVLAILAYGRGLEASDAGDFHAAAEHYGEAAEIDPTFSEAATAAEAASAAAEVVAVPIATVATQAFGAPPAAETTEMDLGADDPLLAGDDAGGDRAPASEVLGTDSFGGTTTIEIIIPRP